MLQLESRPGSARPFLTSVVVHAVAIVLLLTIRFAPAAVGTRVWRVALLAPPRDTPHLSKIQRPRPRVFHPSIPAPRRAETKIALESPPVLALPKSAPPVMETPHIAAPAPPLKTDNLVEVRAAPAPAPPKLALEPAGFSSSEAAAPAHPRSAAASTGAFDSSEPARTVSTRAGLRSGGFSEAAAEHLETVKRSISGNTFGDTTVAHADPVRPRENTSSTTPVEIQFKLRPEYTPEAQRLRIEGEVQLEVVFEASGKLQIVRVVRGLGHGLDDSAIEAARRIRFRPAQSGGRAIDSTAVIHIVFQLAY